MTQTAKHTPGPWDFCHVPGEYGHVITIEEGEIAEAFSEAVGDEQAVANARLIAAAPEMLEALEFVRMTFADIEASKRKGYYTECPTIVAAAIAKAKGGAA